MLKSLALILVAANLVACAQARNPGLPKEKVGAKGTVKEEPTSEAPVATPSDWINKDSQTDHIEGVASDRARQELGLSSGAEIIVAVIDSGVDVDHEDLQGKIWVNPGEIAGNGIDDDGNGYIDDVHGWNFLGTVKDGKNVHLDKTTLEMARELKRMENLKTEKEAIGEKLSSVDARFLSKLTEDVDAARTDAQEGLKKWTELQDVMELEFAKIKDLFGMEFEFLSEDALKKFEAKSAEAVASKEKLLSIFKENGFKTIARLIRAVEYFDTILKFYLNTSFDPRAEIIGDDVNDLNDRNYGNPDVKGPLGRHGTHVAGIIAATRNNGKGMNGIAENVKIMAVRAVPDGDEYDKDVALAVRYAVDNGARIINMSFGKAYSPLKGDVDEAFQYAAAHNVLIVHAAGNDAKDNDGNPSFPNRLIQKTGGAVQIQGWLDVGASGAFKDEGLPAIFSNFGRNTVDIFAPGNRVFSTTPGNTYEALSGTSMAAPSFSGVAALVLSQKPDLTAVELRQAIMENARKHDDFLVNLPGTAGENAFKILFSALSKSHGLADAYLTLKSLLGVDVKKN